ncbi:hypothetical protein [Synechococcus sp. 1G10]|uniref:hypothetical protein n=1 Tax=Synechococcus sp. 1G10 TaxID=2025605 RepID=UPI00117C21F3|nr:hypothetical protein [Synechococcus sp. 1G10]
MNRFLSIFAAAALLAPAPAMAYPQWVPLSKGHSFDFNSVKDHGKGVKSLTLSLASGPAVVVSFHCPTWQFNTGSGWLPISTKTNGEVMAYAICPGENQASMRRALKVPVATTEPEAPDYSGVINY